MKKAKIMLSAIAVLAVVGGAVAFKAQKVSDKVFLEYTNTAVKKCLTFTDYTTASSLGGSTVATPAGYFGFYTLSACTGNTVPFAYYGATE